jgi:wyosine [tRNA(Phe)-imidazoG37] synthetase (radical SAM superfamily)
VLNKGFDSHNAITHIPSPRCYQRCTYCDFFRILLADAASAAPPTTDTNGIGRRG